MQGAVKLYERARAQQPNKQSAGYILLSIDAGRLYHEIEQDKQAADAFAEVMAALEKPKDFGLDTKAQGDLEGEGGKNYELFAKVFTAVDRPKDAIRAWEKVAEKHAGKRGQEAYSQAQIAWIGKDYPQALAKLQIYFDEHETKQGRVPYELLAQVLKAQDKSGELIERLEKVLAGDSSNVRLQYYLADQYREAKNFSKAQTLYAALVDKLLVKASFPEQVDAYRGLVEAYRQTKQHKPLLKTLSQVVEKSDDLDALGDELKTLVGDAFVVQALV